VGDPRSRCGPPLSVAPKAARRLDAGQFVEIEIEDPRIASNASPLAPSRSTSGSASSHAAYSTWSLRRVATAQPDLTSACFGHPLLPPGVSASKGPPQAGVVDKINQFAVELGDRTTSASEQLLVLKFLLHFVGDLHQPLHAADDHDAGGNKKLVAGDGLHPSNLHHYWDVEFVERLGTDPRQVAASLIGQISEPQHTALRQFICRSSIRFSYRASPGRRLVSDRSL
jgi:hypothetical protein